MKMDPYQAYWVLAQEAHTSEEVGKQLQALWTLAEQHGVDYWASTGESKRHYRLARQYWALKRMGA